jgi:putative flippase GtrA
MLIHLMSFPALMANLLSFCVALLNSYVMNFRWTFSDLVDDTRRSHRFVSFVAVNLVGLAISSAVIWLAKSFAPVELAKLLAVVCTLIWNFLGARVLVFRKQ